MVEACKFDFSKYEYSFDPNLTLSELPKTVGKRGKTAATLARLFDQNATSSYSGDLLKTLQLELFTNQLRGHLEASIKRRYWFFGYLIIFVSYTFHWGPLASLKKLEAHFTDVLAKNSQTQRESIQNASQLVGLALALHQIDPLLQDSTWYQEAKKSIVDKLLANLASLSQKDLAAILRYLFHEELSFAWYENMLKKGPAAKELPTLEAALQEIKQDRALSLTVQYREVLQAQDILELEKALRSVDPLLRQAPWYMQAVDRLESMLKEPALEKVRLRYEQMPQDHLSILDRLRLAYFIETKLPTLNLKQIKKNSYDLPLSLHFDPDTKDVYVAFKRKIKLLDTSGVMKKVTAALHLPKTTRELAHLVAHLTSLDKLTPQQIELFIKENKYARELASVEGVWPVLYATEHEKVKEKKVIKKFSQFAKLATGDFSDLGPTMALTDKIKAAHSLLKVLQAFHKKGLIYGDMKGANVLVEKVAERLALIGLIDFGHTIVWNRNEAMGSMREGFYGTPSYTPPELFGVNGYKSEYEKAEVWALGITLYRYCFNKEPSWAEIMKTPEPKEAEEKKPPARRKVTFEEKEAVKNRVKVEIEDALHQLLQKENRTLEERFLLVVYKMLRLKTSERLTVDEALIEIANLM